MNIQPSAKLLASLVALSIAGAQISCSAAPPSRYQADKSGASSDANSDPSNSIKSRNDYQGDGDAIDNDRDENDKSETADSVTDPVNPTDPAPTVPEIADTVIPKPAPAVPDPVKLDPALEAQKKLESDCTIDTVQVIKQDAAGASIFLAAFGDVTADLRALGKANCLAMYRPGDQVRKIKDLVVTVDAHNGFAYANPGLDMIFISTNHLRYYSNPDTNVNDKREIRGVMAHEIGHLYQKFWPSSPQNPAFSEGLCDAIRADLDLYPRTRKIKGGDVYGSYTNTGYFLRYLRKNKDPDFYWKFNKAAQNWNDSFWMQTFGMTVDQLWNEFQQKGFDANDY